MKKILSLVLVAVMLFSFTSICVSAEEEVTPRMSFTQQVQVNVSAAHRLTNEDGTGFGADIKFITKNMVALDGFSDDFTAEITKIEAQKDGESKITYDKDYVDENPDDESTINPFFEYFAVEEGEERKVVSLFITFQVDFVDAEVFGDLGYEITVSGFSAPPDLGELGGIMGDASDSLPIPTTITATGFVEGFPSIVSCKTNVASDKMIYKDSEMVELEGTQVYVVTSNGSAGTVTYAPSNAHMFTTIPAKDKRIPVGTTEIVTYFAGIHLSTLPVTVSHDWSAGPVCITTDKYTDKKPGYHAIVCNGCGEAHSAAQHRPEIQRDEQGNPVLDENGNEIQAWVSNEDATFVGNATYSTTCQDCGATLTKDVIGTAGFNTAFANYHFLLVIFEYINLILRIIGTAVG